MFSANPFLGIKQKKTQPIRCHDSFDSWPFIKKRGEKSEIYCCHYCLITVGYWHSFFFFFYPSLSLSLSLSLSM